MMRNHLMAPEGNSNHMQVDESWYSAGNTPDSPSYNSQQNNMNYGSVPTSPATMNVNNQYNNQYNNYDQYNNNDNMNMLNAANPASIDYENEPPLLEELGINFDHIKTKTIAVINPNASLDEHILDDADLAGPICFCLALGACLLLSGRIHFGYIYGFSVFGCLGVYTVVNLMVPGEGLDFYKTCSVLGYCLLPVVALAAISILVSLKGLFGFGLSTIVIAWCTFTSTR